MGHAAQSELKSLVIGSAWSDFEARMMSPARASSSCDFHLNFEVSGNREWVPGQFVQLFWGDHLMGRPFSIFEWKPQKKGSSLHLLVRSEGEGTRELAFQLNIQDIVWVRGPLGQPIANWNIEKDLQPTLYVSEGSRLAAIFPFVNVRKKVQPADRWIHFEATRDAVDSETMARAFVCPDEIVLGPIQKLESHMDKVFQRVVVAGSFSFLETVLRIIKNYSLELFQNTVARGDEVIACGQGLCFSCTIQTIRGPKRSCYEGPWFSGADILNHLEWKNQK